MADVDDEIRETAVEIEKAIIRSKERIDKYDFEDRSQRSKKLKRVANA